MNAQVETRALLEELARVGVTVARVVADSRAVQSGDLFLAYPGARTDGRRFIADAIQRGAAAVLWEKEGFAWPEEFALPQIGCAGLGDIAGEIADQVYGSPSGKMRVIGVTGTNGKTSSSQWIARTLAHLHQRCGVIGTLGTGFPGELVEGLNTTPDPISVQAALADFASRGAQAVAMEVSSIGLDQGRVNGVRFDTAILTNLTRDHLDYHHSMEAYAAAKAKLFDWPGLRVAVLNADDPFGVELAHHLAGRLASVIAYTTEKVLPTLPGTVRVLAARSIQGTPTGMRFTVSWQGRSAEIEAALVGHFNVSNLLAVIAALLTGGHSLEEAREAILSLTPPPGRMQAIGGVMAPLVVVDYAHTPDALEKALAALRPTAHARGGKLCCVFGCGGDRDPGKRSMMGVLATRLADQVFVTSDNPRSEDPLAIINEILVGAPDARQIPDRAEAIRVALESASADDVILIAGKGHEPYQDVAGVKHPFSDIEQARLALRSWPHSGGAA
jgi:UDP-N-acetylmuramoyl-L-alanyl-D-glutamate--2,6-diaminopimelate ligase